LKFSTETGGHASSVPVSAAEKLLVLVDNMGHNTSLSGETCAGKFVYSMFNFFSLPDYRVRMN
jgi:hypothetical protein